MSAFLLEISTCLTYSTCYLYQVLVASIMGSGTSVIRAGIISSVADFLAGEVKQTRYKRK
jgi:hypothetical protein